MSRQHLLKLLSILLLALGTFCHAADQQVLDGVAAAVNGEVITFSQVREVVGAREKTLRDVYKGEELVQKIKETRLAALNDLIDRQLILQEFKKNNFTLPSFIVEDRIKSIVRQEFGGDRSAFIRTLEAQGYTLTRFKELEQSKIIVQAMRQRSIADNFMIPPSKVEQYYNDHKQEFTNEEQVQLRMIVLKKGEDAGRRKMAQEIRQKIVDGAQFDKIAQMYSEDSSAEAGGDWGWVDRKTLNEELTNVAFNLKPGDLSEVIELSGNYYILTIDSKRGGGFKPLSEVRSQIQAKLTQAERQERERKWLASLRSKAYIKMF